MRNWCLEVWGDYACFTRPEMKVERVSYDVITPSAARAIFEAVLWKPAIRWNITKMEVLHPIKWISVRRNEVEKKASAPSAKQMAGLSAGQIGIWIEDDRQQRAGLFLRDVRYRLHGYFDFIPPEQRRANRPIRQEAWADETERELASADEGAAKYAAMFERRARKGQCYHRPYLGCREFACDFRLVPDPLDDPARPIRETRDLGFMLYDMDFTGRANDPMPCFFRAQMKAGVIHTDRREIEVRG